MAYIKLADGSTFQGVDADVAKAVMSYSAKQRNANLTDLSNISISPEITKIVEKVPVEVEKIVEKAVQVPVLPERPLTQNEIAFLREMKRMSYRQKNIDSAIGLGVGILCLGGMAALIIYSAKNSK